MSKSVVREVSDTFGHAVENTAEQLADKAERGIEQARETITDTVDALSEAVQLLTQAATDLAETAKKGATRELREHPLSTGLLTLAATALIAGLVMRRR